MSLPLAKKQKTANEETVFENTGLLFSYNVVRPLFRRSANLHPTKWMILEKGFKKSPQENEFSYDKVKSALLEIEKYIWETPLRSSLLFLNKGLSIYLKKEFLQSTLSVKARGVAYTLMQLSDVQKRRGIITISTGSFARTLCYFGKVFEIPVTIVMPTSVPDEMVKICREHADSQAKVLVLGNNIVETHKAALHIAETMGLFYLDGNDHPDMIIGQATVAVEILEQMPNVDVVVLPSVIDGCGLTTSIAMILKSQKPDIEVIEVHPIIFDPLIENIRKQTNLLEELEIPVKQYAWYKNRRIMPKCWFNKFITVDKMTINSAESLLREENIDDFNAAIGIAGIICSEKNKNKIFLKGKRVVVPVFGRMDSCRELTMDN